MNSVCGNSGPPPASFAFGYPDVYSVLPSATLVLHLSSTAPSVGVRIYQLKDYASDPASDPKWVSKPLLDLHRVEVNCSLLQPNNDGTSGIEDWKWPPTVEVTIPCSWKTGIYIAEIAAYASDSSTEQIMTSWVMFVVKNPKPTPGASMLYKWNINTIQAYSTALFPITPSDKPIPPYDNDFYENPARTPGSPDFKVTLRRPVTTMWCAKALMYDYPFVCWLSQQGYAVDYCTDVDVELDTSLEMLSYYPLVLFRGHDEYLGVKTYDNLTKYRNNGGNIAFLSGNSCCWRVKYGNFDANNIPTSFVCDKGQYHTCDINGPDAWWVLDQFGQFDNKLVGVGTRNCGIYIGDIAGPFTIPSGGTPASPGYTVQNADHWVFDGTNLNNGDVIGVGNVEDSGGKPITENLIGYEAGGARLADDGSGALTYIDGTPVNFALLGVGVTSPYVLACGNGSSGWVVFSREGMLNPPGKVCGDYAATMGFYSAYGQVFTGATIHWVMILNEWDYDGCYYQNKPDGGGLYPVDWLKMPLYDAQHNPILGNRYLHTITRNVLTALMVQGKTVVAVGDLNGDGKPDLVLQSNGTGEPAYWLMNGTSMAGSGSILYPGTESPGLLLRIVGMGNLTSATSVDLVLQNKTTGAMFYWTLQYSLDEQTIQRVTVAPLVGHIDSNLKAVAVLDLNGDDRPDILFQNEQNGSLWCWLLNGTTVQSFEAFVGSYTPGDLTWVVVTAMDLNGDGNDDLVFQNQNDLSLYYWTIDGRNRTAEGPLTGPAAPGVVVGSADLTGDGTASILFQNPTNGDLTYWSITNFAENGSGTLTPASPRWLGPSPTA
ncbi:MAG: VCBS repeat-containing protein [Acidobacteriota bacterium]